MILTVSVWGWSIANDFVFDDLVNVVSNPWIRHWTLVLQAFSHHAAGFDSSYNTSFYRPFMHVLYALVYSLAGARPWAFHLLNVLFHLLAVCGVYLLTRVVLLRWGDAARYPFLPLVAAIVFCVHPVHTEPVEWIAGITDLSCAVFGLLALIAYVRAFQRAAFSVVAAVLLLASLFCKETGAVLLAVIALFEWFELQRGTSWTRRVAGMRLGPSVAAFGAYLGFRLAALKSFAPSAAQHPLGVVDLAASASALFARYMGLLVAPVHLTVMRSIRLDGGFADPLAVVGFLVVAAFVAIAVRFRRSLIVMLSLAFAVLPLLPVLYVPAIESGGSVFGERYLYLPVLGVAVAFGAALDTVRRRFSWGRSATAALVVLFVGWAATSALARNRVWANSLDLWTDAAAQSPNNAAAQEGLCFALYGAARYPEALLACTRALTLDSARIDARINRATTLLALGRAVEARSDLDVALAARPNSPQGLVNRGLACMMLGQPDEAMTSYRRALAVDPDYPEAHNVIGVALARSGRADEALAHIEQAVRLAPDNPEYRDNLRVLQERRSSGAR